MLRKSDAAKLRVTSMYVRFVLIQIYPFSGRPSNIMNSESRQIASNRTIPHPIAPYRVIALSAHRIFVMSGR